MYGQDFPSGALMTRIAIGYCLLLVGLVFFGIELFGLIGRVDDSSKNQLNNRVSNVATWCGAINEGRDESRTIATTLHRTYVLKDLNCAALEQATRESGKKLK